MSLPSELLPVGLLGTGAATPAAGYSIERSVRFNSADSAYLNRTPASAGNRKTWTWAGWVKLSSVTTQSFIFAANSTSPYVQIYTSSSNVYIQTNQGYLQTTQVFRDPSAWQHWVFAFDTTQATASNRIKFYVNGAEITTWSVDQRSSISQNVDTGVNSTVNHAIGKQLTGSGLANLYLADVHFIDGQALDPTSFGEFDADTGIWNPIAYTGSFGPRYSGETWSSASAADSYAFDGSTAYNSSAVRLYGTSTYHKIVDASTPFTNVTSVVVGTSENVGSIKLDGTVYTTTYASGVGLTVDSPPSSFSDIEVLGASTGLQIAYVRVSGELLIDSGVISGNNSFHLPFSDNSSAAALGDDTSSNGNDWTVNNISVLEGNGNYVPQVTSTAGIRDGKTALDAFDGSLSTGITAATGTNTVTWNAGGINASAGLELYYNGSTDSSKNRVFVNGTQFVPSTNADAWHNVGAVATLNTVTWEFQSTSNFAIMYAMRIGGVLLVDYRAGSGGDSLIDVPTNGTETDTGAGGEVRGNYCTFNPLSTNSNNTLSNGNLDATGVVTGSSYNVGSTFGLSSGKWYWEITAGRGSGSNNGGWEWGVAKAPFNPSSTTRLTASPYGWGVNGNDGKVYSNNSSLVSGYISGTAGSVIANGDTVMVAYDATNGNLWLGKNGTWGNNGGTGDPAAGTNAAVSSLTGTFFPVVTIGSDSGTPSAILNAGARPFAYSAPSGFKALCTANLPAPTIADGSTAMDVALYTGGQPQTISGLEFSPDFVWVKGRSTQSNYSTIHHLVDQVRGADKYLFTNATDSEYMGLGRLTGFTSDGFTVTSHLSSISQTFAAWTWKAGHSSTPTTGAVSFDGSNDYLTTLDSADYPSGTDDFTYEAFVYLSANVGGNQYVLGKGGSGVAEQIGLLYNGTSWRVFMYNSSSSSMLDATWGSPTLNRWHHISVCRSGNNFYGSDNGVVTLLGTSSDSVLDNDALFVIGGYSSTTSPSGDPIAGFISNLRVIKGTALYTSNFTPPTTELTNITNTILLCCQSPTSAGAAAVSPNIISGINDGTVWSSGCSANVAYPINAFDGDVDPYNSISVAYGADWEWTNPVTDSITVNTSLRVFGATFNNSGNTVHVNGSQIGGTGIFNTTYQWIDLTSFLTLPINLNSLRLASGSNVFVVAGIEVDGVVLVDPLTVNGNPYHIFATTYNPLDLFSVDGTGYSTTSAASITEGTIPLTGASVNRSAGFSIVSWSATTGTKTVGHGLGVAPKLVIMKNRSTTSNWAAFHTVLGSHGLLYLNLTNASITPAEASPTSTVFSVAQTSATTGSSGNNMVAYCFAPVEGYSAFGSYTGNASTDGPFVFTGFRPRWLMIKNTSSIGGIQNYASWLILDTQRDSYNVSRNTLWANMSVAEDLRGDGSTAVGSNCDIDICSNGFKIRTGSVETNGSGNTMIWAAFAENPFALNARAQ